MTWYAAHVIVSIRPIVQDEEPISVYENIILMEADDANKARDKANLASTREPGADEGLMIGDKRARTVVEGVRKVVAVSNPWPLDQDSDRPVAGTEITYSKLELKDDKALRDFVEGKEVEITYLE